MKKSTIFVLIFFSILGFIISMILSYDKERRIDIYLQNQLKDASIQFDVTYKNYNELSFNIYNNLISNPQVIKDITIGANSNSKELQDMAREDLYNLLAPIYKDWNTIGIKQLHFHLKNNRSFLRMHSPKKYGDDLTNARYSIKYVNTTQSRVDGLEMGKLDNGFRFVYPIFDQNKHHIGSVEVSISVNDFLAKLEDSFHSKVNLLINKKAVEDEVFKEAIKLLYTETLISPNYYKFKKDMGEYTPKNLPRSVIATMHEKITKEIPFSVYFKAQNNQYQVITFLPIKNIQKNQTLGYIIKHSKNDYIREMQNDYYIVLVMILIILAGITFYAYKDYQYKRNLTDNFKTIQTQKEELSQSVEELERQNIQIAQSIEENRKKDTMIAEQSRLASLGEMIGNIAHQWRQPLSAISTSASSIIIQNDLGILNPTELNPALTKIIEKTQFLSQTIEDFRNFIEGKKEKVEFVISSAIDNALSVVDSSISNHSIIIKKDYQDMIFITNFKNEFIQAILNIINNAKDALEDNIVKGERYVFITVKKEEKSAVIIFQDNAGGIPNDIITKVFEPYFTTKHQSQGTGLGLYMSYKIINDSMKGSIAVINNQFTYNDQTYVGARFEIHLPINEINEASNV